MRKVLALCACIGVVAAGAPASANTEPTAYDTRSIALGLSGVSYLERPAAIALNPALLDGIDKFSFSILLNPLLVNTKAPVSGPNTSVDTGIVVGPMFALFMAGRIAPRVVFGFGVYLEQAYGATFDNVVNVDGAGFNGPNNPQDLTVLFFNGEGALGTSIRVSEKVKLGIALRLPFARQDADLYQNVGAAIGIEAYGNVKNTLSGVGFPSPRIGIAYTPIPRLTLGAMWRAYSRLKLTGTTTTKNVTDMAGTPLPIFDLTNRPAKANWTIPHAVQFGGSLKLLKDKSLMLVTELRLQFHDAPKHGNEDQTVIVDTGNALGEVAAIAPFNWRNIWSLKIGVEYEINKLVAIRGGYNAAVSNIRKAYAQYFTPPPGYSPAYSAGAGFRWEHIELDIATLLSFQNTNINESVSAPGQTIRVGDEDVQVCSAQQLTRTGCAGNYRTRSFWISATFTYKM